VFVRHRADKRKLDPSDGAAPPFVRHACVGFVVMETADDVVNVFKEGLEHTVSGVAISVTAYEHHDPAEVMRNECKLGLQPSCDNSNISGAPRFPTYANITENNSMKANLRKMQLIDADRIFIVKKINKLGYGSAQLLESHFGRFGDVSEVFVTHRVNMKRNDTEDSHARPYVKPSGIGFVAMDKAEDVAAIFEKGMQQTVYGVTITLSIFRQSRATEELEAADLDTG